VTTWTTHPAPRERIALITGGAGFIGTNIAARLAGEGWRVRIFDNLSRAGVEANVRWLTQTFDDRIEMQVGDVRDRAAVQNALRGVSRVFHFAAQVAVTTSLVDPFLDFEVNARGTLNVLETIRHMEARPSLLFTSTNKVYGALDDLPLTADGRRYGPQDRAIAARGIDERRHLDFHSPYGCSKGAAEQYVLDYARTFRLPATVFRMSCIYGPHQFGNEDQGWVAHFAIRALGGQPLHVYGDGLQVRDVLFVDDLADAMIRAHSCIERTAGHAYNIGGGPGHTLSLVELIDLLKEIVGRRPAWTVEPWRAADQRYYVSDCRKFSGATGWAPQVSVREGVARLVAWLSRRDGAASWGLKQVAS
jgi:CDP-paratose 2-epimerase